MSQIWILLLRDTSYTRWIFKNQLLNRNRKYGKLNFCTIPKKTVISWRICLIFMEGKLSLWCAKNEINEIVHGTKMDLNSLVASCQEEMLTNNYGRGEVGFKVKKV